MLPSRLLYMFTVVAEELHFGRAAARLHMTQPPLSQQIRQLEQLVGADLFNRNTRSVSLTPAGNVLLERARKHLLDGDAILRAVQMAAHGEGGVLALGFTASSTYQVLPLLLSEFRRQYPGVTLTLRELSPETMLDDLVHERLDVALLRPPPECVSDRRLTFTAITEESLVIAMRADHPLAQRDTVPVQCLDRLPFIGFSPTQARYSYELCQRIFSSHNIQPEIVQESMLPTMLALVAAGLGAALVPSSAKVLWNGSVHYRKLTGAHHNVASLYAVRPIGASHPAADHFVRLATQMSYQVDDELPDGV